MKMHTLKRTLQHLALPTFMLAFCSTVTSEDFTHAIKDHKIEIGTVEETEKPGILLFRWEEREEKVELSRNRSKISDDELPDMKIIGFRVKDGEALIAKDMPPVMLLVDYLKNHTMDDVTATIFEGINHSRLEIKTKGKTPVCKVTVLLDHGIQLSMWKNISVIPQVDDGEKKGTSDQGKPKEEPKKPLPSTAPTGK